MSAAWVFVGFSIVRETERMLGDLLFKGKNRGYHRKGANIVGHGKGGYI